MTATKSILFLGATGYIGKYEPIPGPDGSSLMVMFFWT